MKALSEAYLIIDQKYFKEKLFLIWLICVLTTHNILEPVQIIGFILCFGGLFSTRLISNQRFWYLLGIVLALNQIERYFYAANHYWLCIYITFAIGIYHHAQNKDDRSFNVFRYLFIVVFGFATFYKIKSSFFRTGRLLSDYALRDHTLPSTFRFIYGDKMDTAVQNYKLNNELLACKFPVDGQSIELVLPDPSFTILLQVITISVIIIELLIFLSLVLPKYFYSKHFPLIIILFVWSTFIMRNEYGFFSLLCVLTYFSRTDMIKEYKLAMVVTIALFLSFEISDISIFF